MLEVDKRINHPGGCDQVQLDQVSAEELPTYEEYISSVESFTRMTGSKRCHPRLAVYCCIARCVASLPLVGSPGEAKSFRISAGVTLRALAKCG